MDLTTLPIRQQDDILSTALDLATKGFAPHWLHPRSKRPVGKEWSIRPVATASHLCAQYRPGYNVGVRCGHWSRPAGGYGLVVVDIDIKHPDVHCEPFEYLGRFYDGPVADVLSGSGLGRHWWFASPLDDLPLSANTTLAKSADLHNGLPVWKIEILSTGGHIVCPPSIHPDTGKRYRWLTGYADVPELPRSILRAIDKPPPEAPRSPQEPPSSGDSIADRFNASVPWADILEPHGWQFVRQKGGRLHWCRPGKKPKSGISATTTGEALFVFSSSTQFEAGRAYSKFQAYAILEHGGDMSQAARRLRGDGV